jgi:hypothetical protein
MKPPQAEPEKEKDSEKEEKTLDMKDSSASSAFGKDAEARKQAALKPVVPVKHEYIVVG